MPSSPQPLASINLDDCPYRGRVLDLAETDRRVEERWSAAPGIPESLLPTKAGLPLKPQFLVCPLGRVATDSLVIANGAELLVFAPKGGGGA